MRDGRNSKLCPLVLIKKKFYLEAGNLDNIFEIVYKKKLFTIFLTIDQDIKVMEYVRGHEKYRWNPLNPNQVVNLQLIRVL